MTVRFYVEFNRACGPELSRITFFNESGEPIRSEHEFGKFYGATLAYQGSSYCIIEGSLSLHLPRASMYSMKIGGSTFGPLTYEELRKDNWNWSVSYSMATASC